MKNAKRIMLAAGLLFLQAAEGSAGEITVRLNFDPQSRNIIILLFNSANSFGDLRDPFQTIRFPEGEERSHALGDIPAGDYALTIFSDQNGDGVLNRNFIGIPVEPIGYSNDYHPRGPPIFNRARFTIRQDESVVIQLSLSQTLGKRGRWGVGLGVIGKSSPYRESKQAPIQPVPALTYIGDRFQVLGPTLQWGLLRGKSLALSLRMTYRIGAYEEDDSPILSGMGDRKNTLMTGAALNYNLPKGFKASAGYAHDTLDKIGGGMAQAGLSKSFQWMRMRLTPKIGFNWLSSELVGYEFGVPGNKAAAGRPAYDTGDAFTLETGLTSILDLYGHLQLLGNLGFEFLGREITDSPIVGERQTLSYFAALNYVF